MSNLTIEGIGKFTPDPSSHLGTGGEASVFEYGSLAVKILKDPVKARSLGLDQRLNILLSIKSPRLATPSNKVFDNKGNLVGYAMPKVSGPTAFSVSRGDWRRRVGFQESHALKIAENMRLANLEAHKGKAVVVDGNSMNYIVNVPSVVMIDTDSWQLPGFSATAIVDSIRDPLLTGNVFTQESDWYSYAVTSFEILIGIHPFKGIADGYSKLDFAKRVKDRVSVCSPGVKLGPGTRPLSIIPPELLEWYKNVFEKDVRSPPSPISEEKQVQVVSPQPVRQVISKGSLQHIKLCDLPEEIIRALPIGVILTKSKYFDSKRSTYPELGSYCIDDGFVRSGTTIHKVQVNNVAYLSDITCGTLFNSNTLSSIVYYPTGLSIDSNWNIYWRCSSVYKDLIYMDNMGIPFFYEKLLNGEGLNSGTCKDLIGHTILDGFGLGTGHILVLSQDKQGVINKSWYKQGDDRTNWILTSREVTDISSLNIARTEKGVWVEIPEDGELRYGIDSNPDKITTIKDSGILFDMTLFQGTSGIHYFIDKSVFWLKLK